MNNRSYNDERNRILQLRGRSYETGLDMSCYLGDPDVNYAQLASGFGVEGEVIDDADSIKAAVQRAQSATKEGRAYLLDVHVARTGPLANSTWHPEYHISSLRSRQV
jgi:thiamine pyrophosphate-dependent acetolactate synthase large subunit-like protein